MSTPRLVVLAGLAACASPSPIVVGDDAGGDASVDAPDDTGVDAAEPAVLRVMTYNIQRGGPLGASLDAIAAVITTHAPDVVALQEVDYLQPGSGFVDEARYLAEHTGLGEYFFGCTVGCGSTLPGRYGLALLSRFPLSDRTKAWLPNTTSGVFDESSDLEPRVLLCGTATPPSAAPFRICVTHLTNGSATPDAPVIRVRQAEAIAALANPIDRLILAGDLNEVPGQPAVALLGAILTDAWPGVGVGPGATIPSDAPTVRFDYVLRGAGLGPTLSAVVPVSTASDHRPVVVELTR